MGVDTGLGMSTPNAATNSFITPQAATTAHNWNITPTEAVGRPATTLSAKVDDFIATWPTLAMYIGVPELYDEIQKGVALNETPDQILARIKGTEWSKTRTDSERAFDSEWATNGRTMLVKVDQMATTIKQQAKAMGVTIADQAAADMGKQVLRQNWTEQQIRGALSVLPVITKGAATTGVATQGIIGQNQMAAKQLAAQYGIRLDDATALQIGRDVAESTLDPTSLQARWAQQARALYPWMANLLDMGVTPQHYFDPIRQSMARELEMPEDAIDITDSRWSSMMQVRDPKTNEMRPASIEEARLNVRKDPRWAQTQNAQDTMAELTMALGRRFGLA